MVNFTVTICRPYVPDLLLVTGAGLNSMRYNAVLDSTEYIEIMVPNTVLGTITILGKIGHEFNH